MSERPSINLLSIDPGSDTLGVAVFNVDVETFKINHTTATGYRASRFSRQYWNGESTIAARLTWIYENLVDIFNTYNPSAVIVESNFMSIKHPEAYGALVRVMCVIKDALHEFNPFMNVYMVSPIEGKFSVGAGRSDKGDTLRPFVIKTKELNYQGEIGLDKLDEHALDSIVVGYAKYKQFYEQWEGTGIQQEILSCLKKSKRR